MLKKLITHIKLATAAGLMMAVVGGAMLPQPALAAPIDVLKACDAQSQVCKGTNKNSLYTVIENVINVLLYAIGIISVIMIIIGGIRYATSGGDSSQTKSARDTIIYAVAGLVVAIMSFSLVNFVLSRL